MRIEVPHPVADLYTFYGRLEIPGQDSLALGTDNLMLRGSRVKNTEWAIGCAVYTGQLISIMISSFYYYLLKFYTKNKSQGLSH